MCDKLFRTIELLENEYLDFLEEVCNIESKSSNKKSVDLVGEKFIQKAKKLKVDINVMEHDISGNAVCITMNKESKEKPICISGHIDTVFNEGVFGYPPVKRDNEKMYGPGVIDCKGGVVAGLMAMNALKNVGYKKRPVKLILQTDEEVNSATSDKKTIEFIHEMSKNALAFLNLESYVKDTAVLERKGILKYKFEVYGKAIHASQCFNGANAITEAAHKIIELEKMKDPNGLTCSCNVINGGTATNAVADYCSFYTDIRFSNNEELNLVKKKINEIAENNVDPNCYCKITELSIRPPMQYSETNKKLLEKMNKIYEKCGMPVLKGRKSLGGSDAAYITQFNIPCVDCIGVEGGDIHATTEFMYLKSLKESATRIASVIYLFDEEN